MDKRGRRIRNIDFLTALRRSNAKYARMEVTHFSNTVNDGILYARKAKDFANSIDWDMLVTIVGQLSEHIAEKKVNEMLNNK